MATRDDISLKILDSLKEGPYACSSLEKLSGGTANFVYRGTLIKPLAPTNSNGNGFPNGKETDLSDDALTNTVVIKHTEPYVASHPGFRLTSTRCEYERTISTALFKLPFDIFGNIMVTTPFLYHFSSETNTQIYFDLPGATELKSYLLNHSLTQAECSRLGTAIGKWTWRFHTWAEAPEQAGLKEKMKGNVAMRDLKFNINYTRLIETVEIFPEVLGESKQLFEKVAKQTREELDKEEGVLIHGDFWSGNVILRNITFPSPPDPEDLVGTDLFEVLVVDWEMCQVSSIAFDLGQMVAELFMLTHFKDIDAGVWLIESFMDGYGSSRLIGETLAFKTAIHAGAHLICWGSRVPGWGTKRKVEAVVELGREFIIKGWERDRKYFEETPFRCLFIEKHSVSDRV